MTDDRGMNLCLGCGLGGHTMRRCRSPPKPANVAVGTRGFTFHGFPGCKHEQKQAAQLAAGQPSTTSAPPASESQPSQSGKVAVTKPAATGYNLAVSEDSDGTEGE